MPIPDGTVDIIKLKNGVVTTYKWIRDSWARKKIIALQQAVSSIVVPTNVSAFNNDAGYLTSAPVTSVNGKTGTVSLNASDVLSATQMDAVNSGITASKVARYDALSTFFDVPEAIPSRADLNDYMTPGHYTANTGSIAGSLVNSPIASINFTLLVFYRTETRMSQLIIPASASLYIRYEGTSGWESWRKISTTAV